MKYNNSFLDWWTLVHLGTGIGLGLIKIPRPYAYPLLIGFEILENIAMRKGFEELFKEKEGPINAISDILVASGGYEVTRRLSQNSSNTAISP